MGLTKVGRSWYVVLVFLAMGSAQPAQGQGIVEQLGVRIHGGMVMPVASYGDYYNFGPSVGMDIGYPLNDRLDLKLDLDWEYVNSADIYPSPNTNLFRYRLGLEGDVLGDQGSDMTILKALGGVGLTTSKSHPFWLASRRPYTYAGERLDETVVSAMGGVRAGLRTGDGITWWLTGKANWAPMDDLHKEALQELARNELDLLDSAMSFSLTLGVTLR